MKSTFKKIISTCLFMIPAFSMSLIAHASKSNDGHLTINSNKDFDIISKISKYNIESVTIKDGVTYIGKNSFKGFTNLKNVTISNSVKEIGDGAFSGCTGLTSITIPDSVTKIGECAFAGCTGLTSITIPNSVTEIGDRAFYGCTGLKEVTVPKSAKVDDNTFDENTTVHRK